MNANLLRDDLLVHETDDDAASPFGVADYVQLAGMGGRSVILEIHGHVAGHGTIVIHAGSLWSASDERGIGLEAFRRLVFLSDATVRCLALDEGELKRPRMLDVSCEGALLDAARLHDETGVIRAVRSSRPPDPGDIDRSWQELSTFRPPAMSAVHEIPASLVAPRVPAELRSVRPSPSFADLYEEAVDALLRRRFGDAYRAFSAANAAQPGDSRVRTNLERLEAMGYKS
jgi:hypothetical protein